jgi:hypothetical protein
MVERRTDPDEETDDTIYIRVIQAIDELDEEEDEEEG